MNPKWNLNPKYIGYKHMIPFVKKNNYHIILLMRYLEWKYDNIIERRDLNNPNGVFSVYVHDNEILTHYLSFRFMSYKTNNSVVIENDFSMTLYKTIGLEKLSNYAITSNENYLNGFPLILNIESNK